MRKLKPRGESEHEWGDLGGLCWTDQGLEGSREQPKVTQPELGLTPVFCLLARDLSKVSPVSWLRGACSPVFQQAARLTAGTCRPNGAPPPRPGLLNSLSKEDGEAQRRPEGPKVTQHEPWSSCLPLFPGRHL